LNASDPTPKLYRDQRRGHWNRVHAARRAGPPRNLGYHNRLRAIIRTLVPPASRVLELGCAGGDLLASLRPSLGVGIDFSYEAVSRARAQHKELAFICADAHAIPLTGKFDYIVMSDLLNDVWDVQMCMEQLRQVCHPRTRLIINTHSHLWELPLRLLKWLGLSTPVLRQNWLTIDDINSLFRLSGWEPLRSWPEVLIPLRLPLLAAFANRFLVRVWPFSLFAAVNCVVARPEATAVAHHPSVSVIVPARNEAGRIVEIMQRVPDMGEWMEIIFVEGHSTDKTYETVEAAIASAPGRRLQLWRQPGKGKGDAVRFGFERARGEILMILDADLTVAPEDLPRFYQALASGRGEFANGVRLVYPMEDQAMQFANLLANKAFGWIFSWILGQPVRDTLCGTKVLWRRDYHAIARGRQFFGDFDPFGDFDLLFGAARLNLRIIDIPVRYRERTYGQTNIRRWRHGILLARMASKGARKLRFV